MGKKEAKDKLAELMEKLNEGDSENVVYPTFHEIPTQRAVECDEDISLINVKSKTSLFDTMMSLRLFDKPRKPTTFKTIKAYHHAIMERLKHIVSTVNLNDPSKYDPPDIKMVKRILEQGYLLAAKKVIDLINIEIAETIMERSSVNKVTSLEQNFDLIIILLLLFKKADKYKRLNKVEEETSIYLYLAIYYERDDQWLWLSFELYTHALNACNSYTADHGLTEATVRYLLGRLCLFKMKDFEETIVHLQIVCKLSKGRSWSASAFSGIKDDYIYPAASHFLYLAHIAMVSEKKVEHPKEILLHLQEALIISSTGEEYKELLIPLADAYNNVNNPKDAKMYLKEYVTMVRSSPQEVAKEMSLSNYEFAKYVTLRFFYYNICDDKDNVAIEYLYNFYKMAKMEKDEQSEAFAYKYYGLLYLKKELYNYAYCLLCHAARMFQLLNDGKNALIIVSILAYQHGETAMTDFSGLDVIDRKLFQLFTKNVGDVVAESTLLHDLYEYGETEREKDKRQDPAAYKRSLSLDQKGRKKLLSKHEKIIFQVYLVERPKIKKKLKQIREIKRRLQE